MDPYKVLGVSRDADEETIKKAYRALVKKYHPDRYVNTPMADIASEKMKEINEAYDMITNKKTTNSYSSYGGYGGNAGGYSSWYNDFGEYNSGYDYSNVSFDTVRRLISIRRLTEAENMLNSLPQTAEWYYLKGVIYMNRGWYAQGMEFINKAIALDPDNAEYKAAASSYSNGSQNYGNVVFSSRNIPCSICTSLCLSWLCCNGNCCLCC